MADSINLMLDEIIDDMRQLFDWLLRTNLDNVLREDVRKIERKYFGESL